MSPLLLAQLRRHWQVVGALLVFLAFMTVQLNVFQPAARRYRAALKRAGEAGLAMESSPQPRIMPPRVMAMLTSNSLPADDARERGDSGALTASLMDDLNRLCTRNGLEVVQTEPGLTASLSNTFQVRAHLRIQCTYAEFVALADDMSRSGRLLSIDRFSLVAVAPGRHLLDLWVTRCILRQGGTRR